MNMRYNMKLPKYYVYRLSGKEATCFFDFNAKRNLNLAYSFSLVNFVT